MKNSNLLAVIILTLIAFSVSSCEAIAGIFKAGMGFGAFAVIAVLVLLVYVITRMGKSKK